MKTNSFNALCWLVSAGLAVGLALFLTSWKKRQPQITAPVDQSFAAQVLTSVEGGSREARWRPDYGRAIRTAWEGMDWSGAPPAPPSKGDNTPKAPPKKPRVPVSQLLSIKYWQIDGGNPGGSRIFVQYVGKLVQANDPSGIGNELKVGDRLPEPFADTVLLDIRRGAVEFTFADDEERPNEVLVPGVDDAVAALIRHVPTGAKVQQPLLRPRGRVVPQARTVGQSRKLSENEWEIGAGDAEYFGENFQTVLTRDLRTKTRFDKNGRAAGVEITSVKAGSIAARHGASEGDVIISINGQSVTSEQQAIQYVKNNSEGTSTWTVVVESLGKRETRVYHSPED